MGVFVGVASLGVVLLAVTLVYVGTRCCRATAGRGRAEGSPVPEHLHDDRGADDSAALDEINRLLKDREASRWD